MGSVERRREANLCTIAPAPHIPVPVGVCGGLFFVSPSPYADLAQREGEDMIQGMRTPSEHMRNGRNLIYTGQLVQVRIKLGFTRSAMAQLLHMSRATYNKCEDDRDASRTVWASTAERLGRFVYLMEIHMERLAEDGISLSDMMPLHVVALQYGLPQEVLHHWQRQEHIPVEDLGVLGLWMRKDDLHMLDNTDYF